jgi:hypothetical protein
MTKKTNQIKREHFDPAIRDYIIPHLKELATQAVDDYNKHLYTRGKKLTDNDKLRMIDWLTTDATATMTLSVDYTDRKLMEDYDIFPISLNQSQLELEPEEVN